MQGTPSLENITDKKLDSMTNAEIIASVEENATV